jgi:hypothetical protein
VARPIRVVDLTDSMCRWPIGEPHDPNFTFCGCEGASFPYEPYCPKHANVAYSRPGRNVPGNLRGPALVFSDPRSSWKDTPRG